MSYSLGEPALNCARLDQGPVVQNLISLTLQRILSFLQQKNNGVFVKFMFKILTNR